MEHSAAKYLALRFLAYAALIAGTFEWLVLAVGGLNTVLSLFYYLRVIKTMVFDPLPDETPELHLDTTSQSGLYPLMIALPVLVLGIFPGLLSEFAQQVAAALLP